MVRSLCFGCKVVARPGGLVPRGDEPEACPLLAIQTMGKSRTPTRLREGSGGTSTAAASSGAQEETSCTRVQRASAPGQACQTQGAGQEAYHDLGQAAGVACHTAAQGPTTPQGACYDPYLAGKTPGGRFAGSQEDPDGTSGTVLSGLDEVRPNPGHGRRHDCVHNAGGVFGQSGALQGLSQSSARLGSPRIRRCAGGRGRGHGWGRGALGKEKSEVWGQELLLPPWRPQTWTPMRVGQCHVSAGRRICRCRVGQRIPPKTCSGRSSCGYGGGYPTCPGKQLQNGRRDALPS
eukprot:1749180-Amphidinium_carterae.1